MSDPTIAPKPPIIIHQPSPYPADSEGAASAPRLSPSEVYHGDAELHSPVIVKTEGLDTALGKRAGALDALRGLFLMSMTFGFTIHETFFSTWMYHRQFPPPTHDFVDIAGISWRDVTYGAFLFSMAAAIPITLARRIARGTPELGIVFAAFRRGFMLFFFALMIGHSNTYFTGYNQTARALAILGFVITFVVFTQPRREWNQEKFAAVQKWAWIAAIAFLALTPLVYGKHFSFERHDDIIASLAFAATTGWIIWYFTRKRIAARLVIMAIVMALFMGSQEGGKLQEFWYSSPLPSIFNYSSLVLLCVVIPGTIAGDLVLQWLNTPEPAAPVATGWSRGRAAALILLAVAATPIIVVGEYHRWELATAVTLFAVCAALIAISRTATTPTERLIHKLILWSSVWLVLGMLLEPMYGGIRKVPDNLSYYISMAGVSMLLLTAATVVIDFLKGQRAVQFLTDVGQNPMLCYILYTVFLNSLFEMIPPMRGFMEGSPQASLVRSFLTVLLVGLITRAFTRRKIFWRA